VGIIPSDLEVGIDPLSLPAPTPLVGLVNTLLCWTRLKWSTAWWAKHV